VKLVKAQIQNFRSIEDSGEFEISDLTCFVGKNEAGKTALLQALLGVQPIGAFAYEQIRDYPRRFLSRYEERHEGGKSLVAKTHWALDPADSENLTSRLGPNALAAEGIEITSYMGNQAQPVWSVPVNATACLQHLIASRGLDESESSPFRNAKDGVETHKALKALSQRTPRQEQLLDDLAKCANGAFDQAAVEILSKTTPRFFYTSHFDRMSGEISLTKLAADRQANTVSVGDQIFLDFLDYAGTSVEELQKTNKYEELKATCEGASNEITDEIFQFWSQNEALEVKIDLGEGKPGDPPPFNSGTVAKIRIENRNHRVSIPLSERSAGFVWFFSFLAQFKQLRAKAGNAIILLDEPGLTLHGKAQADLLRYIRERLVPEHQVIFTTHSPFIIPIDRMSDVRIVEDIIERPARGKAIVHGTKVKTDVLSVDQDTIFPLQGALGYDITQSLFVGENTLLVEGPSDILYMHVFSDALKRRGRTGLDPRWTLCPSGGIDKIAPFVALFSANTLSVAVFSDFASTDKAKIDRLKKSQVLRAGRLLTAAEFSGKNESEIEDLFHPELYAKLLNEAFDLPIANILDAKKLDAADKDTEKLVGKAVAAFKSMPESPEYNHFTPADWLVRHPQVIEREAPEVLETLGRFENVFKAFNALLKDD
jgi:hypothetical protein